MARPRSGKNKFHIALDPSVMDALKAKAVTHSVPVGDIIAALVAVAEIEPNPVFLTQKIISLRDSFALYIPSDPAEAEKILMNELERRRAAKSAELADEISEK